MSLPCRFTIIFTLSRHDVSYLLNTGYAVMSLRYDWPGLCRRMATIKQDMDIILGRILESTKVERLLRILAPLTNVMHFRMQHGRLASC